MTSDQAKGKVLSLTKVLFRTTVIQTITNWAEYLI